MDRYSNDMTGTNKSESNIGVTKPVSLTGVWTCDDGAHYYIRQLGNDIWWAGLNSEGEGTVFTNVFMGHYNPDTNVITGQFVDVPRGRLLFQDQMELLVVSNTGFVKLTGAFGGNSWTFLKSHGI